MRPYYQDKHATLAYGIDLDERSCETAARALEGTEAGLVRSFKNPARGTLEPRRMVRVPVAGKSGSRAEEREAPI